MLLGREFLGKDFRDFGALESVASGTGIARRAGEVLKAQGAQIEPEGILAEEVFDAARQGQAWASGIIEETVDFLAMAVANLAVMFDPEVIVLGGGVSRSADMLIEPIARRLDGVVPALPRLVASSLGLRAGVMGAITNVLHNTSSYYLVRKLS